MRRTLGAAAFTAAALCLTSLPAAATAAPAHRPAQPHAQVWLTTADDSAQLQPQAPVDFHPGGSDLTTITVDPNRTFQTMDGFGGAMTDSSAAVLSTLAPAARDAAMRKLFDPRQGIGVSFLRQPVGSSDFTAAAAHYTYDDMPAGQADFGLTHFSIAHDQAQILPRLEAGDTVLVAAHGNSLRALVMAIEGLTPEQILKRELATGEPVVYRIGADGRLVERVELAAAAA